MAEPWVPKTELTAAQSLMTELEVFTDAAEVYTDSVAANVALALTYRNQVQSAAQQTFNPLMLGCG